MKVKVRIPKKAEFGAVDGEDKLQHAPKTVEIDIAQRFIDYIHHLENEGMRVQRITIHHRLLYALRQHSQFLNAVEHGREDVGKSFAGFLYGVKIKSEDLGVESVTDFLIYTDQKVLHSDMIDKDFIEEAEPQRLMDAVNEKIGERDV